MWFDLHEIGLRYQVIIDQDFIYYHHSVPAKDVYTLPVFTKEFCDLMVEEIKYFENSPLPKGRPNTMNKSGVSLTPNSIIFFLYS